MSLHPRSGSAQVSAQAPVQEKTDPAAVQQREQQVALTQQWMGVAVRPDLNQEMPVQRNGNTHGVGCGCAGCAGLSAGARVSRSGDGDRADGEQPFDDGQGGDGEEVADGTDPAVEAAGSEGGTPPDASSEAAPASSSEAAPESTPAPAPAPAPAPLTITSRTLQAAPDGTANTRTTVGVGERVEFTGSEAGTWTASNGTPAAGAAATRFTWKAPATRGTSDITLTVGSRSQRLQITVIAPTGLSMVANGTSDPIPAGTAGVCMFTDVTIQPLNVCLGQVKWLEVPGPATNVTGYYTALPAAELYHHPNPNYLQFNSSNTGLSDHCASHAEVPPYSAGTYDWVVPNKYIIAGEAAGAGRLFTTTTQAHVMEASGRMTVSKAGASLSRSP